MEISVTPTENLRKWRVNMEKCKRMVAKTKRYSAVNLPELPTSCEHNNKLWRCNQLIMSDRKDFHNAFYSHKSKISQDNFILKHCEAKEIKRPRPKNSTKATRSLQIQYCIRSGSKAMIPVCQKAFIKVLDISLYRILRIVKQFREHGIMPSEKRGSDYTLKRFVDKKLCVMNFINKLKCKSDVFAVRPQH